MKSKDDEASSTEEDWDADEKEEATEEKKESKVKSPKVSLTTLLFLCCIFDIEVLSSKSFPCKYDVKQFYSLNRKFRSQKTKRVPVGKTPTRKGTPHQTRRCRALGLTCTSLACTARKNAGHSLLVLNYCLDIFKKPSVIVVIWELTLKGYAKHLMSTKHRMAMSGVARRHKAQLLRMRVAQRGAQRELEAGAGAELAARTTFCLICRLNHRTTRQAHNLTDTHRAMRRFLMPFCRICRITFRSPMIYEHHICSLEHLKVFVSIIEPIF